MKVVIQRVSAASVTVDGKIISQIENGALVLVGLKSDDSNENFDYIINKILNLRIFNDSVGVMNKSIIDNKLEVLLVSQFTLYADCKKGNRPSYKKAMTSQKAKSLYMSFVSQFKETYSRVQDGEFGADMKVELANDGPVTIILEN